MKVKTTLAAAALIGAFGFAAPSFAEEAAPAASTKQPAPAAAAPAAKPAAGAAGANTAAVIPAECAKLTDLKAKDDCVKKAHAAAGGAASGASSGASGSSSKN